MPTDETLSDMGIESPWDLTGLYRGIPMTQRSVSNPVAFPDSIFLYREAICWSGSRPGRIWASWWRGVLVHEIAHHFGFSDDDIERIETEMS
ncbi:MAG: metallopeptidase family protein [Rhodospirillales bacterium]